MTVRQHTVVMVGVLVLALGCEAAAMAFHDTATAYVAMAVGLVACAAGVLMVRHAARGHEMTGGHRGQ